MAIKMSTIDPFFQTFVVSVVGGSVVTLFFQTADTINEILCNDASITEFKEPVKSALAVFIGFSGVILFLSIFPYSFWMIMIEEPTADGVLTFGILIIFAYISWLFASYIHPESSMEVIRRNDDIED